MKTFSWKTDEVDIDQNTRTVIATESVTVKEERVEEFTLEQKEQGLLDAQKLAEVAQQVITDLKAEIAEIKVGLSILDVE